MRVELEQTTGIRNSFFHVVVVVFSTGELGQYYTTISHHEEKQKSQSVASK